MLKLRSPATPPYALPSSPVTFIAVVPHVMNEVRGHYHVDLVPLDANMREVPIFRNKLPQQPPVMTRAQSRAFAAALTTASGLTVMEAISQAAIPFAEAVLGLTGLSVMSPPPAPAPKPAPAPAPPHV